MTQRGGKKLIDGKTWKLWKRGSELCKEWNETAETKGGGTENISKGEHVDGVNVSSRGTLNHLTKKMY